MFNMVNKVELRKHLSSLGFDAQERSVLVRILEQGPSTPLALSRALKLNRTTLYRVLERLRERGVVAEVHDVEGKRYSVASPEQFNRLWREEQLAAEARASSYSFLQGVMQDMVAGSTVGFSVKEYHGVEGIKQMLWNELAAEKEVLVFGYQTMNEFVGKPFAEKQREEVMERGIRYREILNFSDKAKETERYTAFPQWHRYHVSRYIPDTLLTIRQGIQTYNQTVSIFSWKDEHYVGVELVNGAFSLFMRQAFEHYWGLARSG